MILFEIDFFCRKSLCPTIKVSNITGKKPKKITVTVASYNKRKQRNEPIRTSSQAKLTVMHTNYSILLVFFLLNIVKSCGRLVPPEKAKVYLPCYFTFGSSCTLGCMDGYIAIGDTRATCRLTNSSEVAWDSGNFTCEGLSCS